MKVQLSGHPCTLDEPLPGNSELSSFDGSVCIARGDAKADAESAPPEVRRQRRAAMTKAAQREARKRRDVAARASRAARRRKNLHSSEPTVPVAGEAEQPTVAVQLSGSDIQEIPAPQPVPEEFPEGHVGSARNNAYCFSRDGSYYLIRGAWEKSSDPISGYSAGGRMARCNSRGHWWIIQGKCFLDQIQEIHHTDLLKQHRRVSCRSG